MARRLRMHRCLVTAAGCSVRRYVTTRHASGPSNKTNVPDHPLPTRPHAPAVRIAAPRAWPDASPSTAAIAVGVVQSLLLVPVCRSAGLSGIAFAIASALLSSVAVGVLVLPDGACTEQCARRDRRRFWSAADDGASQAAANSNWSDLDASLIQLHETTRQRLAELKSSREAVVRQNSANRRIADHLKQAQRIARVGSWEWERKTNRVVCSEEVFRLLHVDREHVPRRRPPRCSS